MDLSNNSENEGTSNVGAKVTILSPKKMLSRAEIDAAANSVFTSVSKNIPSKKTAVVVKTPARPLSTKVSIFQTPSTPSVAVSATPGSTAREAAKTAKLLSTAEKSKKTKELKERWAKDKEEHLQRNAEKKEADRQRVQEASLAAAAQRKREIDANKALAERQKQAEKELLAASHESRKQVAVDLEAQAKQSKRECVQLSNEMKRKAAEKEAEIAAAQRAREEEELAHRRFDALQVRQSKKVEEARRRESMAMRGEMYKKQKEVCQMLQDKAREEERSILEFRHHMSLKTREAREDEQQRARDEASRSLQAWRQQRIKEGQTKREEESFIQYSLETRRLDWQDMENYKKVCARRARESVLFRLDKWRDEKAADARQVAEEAEAAEYEALLRQQEAEDVRSFRLAQENSRKQSLLFRIDKARHGREQDRAEEEARKLIEEEDRRLREADREDVKTYMQSIVSARRQSLAYRGQADLQERLRLEGQTAAQQAAEREDRELALAAMLDVKDHISKEREAARKSLAFRLVEARKLQEMELGCHQQALNSLHQELESRRLDWLDLNEAKAADKERSRQSIAFRMDSWRQQRLAEEMLLAKQQLLEAEEARLREQDREDLLVAKSRLQHENSVAADCKDGKFIL